jgi:hypothetical protein
VQLMRRLAWWRSELGAYISRDRIVVVERDGVALRWVLDGPGVGHTDLSWDAIATMMERLPSIKGAVRGRRMAVVLGADLVQCKALFGLPPVRDKQTEDAIVQESAARFFRRTAEELVTSSVVLNSEGRPAAAAFPSELLRAIAKWCAAHRIGLVAVIPVEGLHSHDGGEGISDDPGVRVAWRAAGLGRAGHRAPFNVVHAVRGATAGSRTGMRAAATGVGLSLLFMLATPLLVARAISKQAERERSPDLAAAAGALGVARELATVSETLAELHIRDAERRTAIGLIAALANALPPGAAMTYLHVDSTGATLTALAPSADALLRGVAGMGTASAPQIVGPVTRERHAGQELQRVSLRFSQGPGARAQGVR